MYFRIFPLTLTWKASNKTSFLIKLVQIKGSKWNLVLLITFPLDPILDVGGGAHLILIPNFRKSPSKSATWNASSPTLRPRTRRCAWPRRGWRSGPAAPTWRPATTSRTTSSSRRWPRSRAASRSWRTSWTRARTRWGICSVTSRGWRRTSRLRRTPCSSTSRSVCPCGAASPTMSWLLDTTNLPWLLDATKFSFNFH